ncbi:hypothetical protein CRG98_019293 [Punica granatum]|uniref:Uncharacterized protein n=1 Tax=Punica granatum TaxID=22663 RepID=A0A2I0JVM0_PUNGR|nr:hypothetical protein CRG98_019293 [Punica granatum]
MTTEDLSALLLNQEARRTYQASVESSPSLSGFCRGLGLLGATPAAPPTVNLVVGRGRGDGRNRGSWGRGKGGKGGRGGTGHYSGSSGQFYNTSNNTTNSNGFFPSSVSGEKFFQQSAFGQKTFSGSPFHRPESSHQQAGSSWFGSTRLPLSIVGLSSPFICQICNKPGQLFNVLSGLKMLPCLITLRRLTLHKEAHPLFMNQIGTSTPVKRIMSLLTYRT